MVPSSCRTPATADRSQGSFADESTAAFSMYQLVAGKAFANVLNLVIIIGSFTCGLAIQASTSRLLYVMVVTASCPAGSSAISTRD